MDYELERELIRKGCHRSAERLRLSREALVKSRISQKLDFTTMSMMRESKENYPLSNIQNNESVKTVKDA